MPLILMIYRGHAPSEHRVTPNMMMLSRQSRLPIQAMFGMPLGRDEEEQTMCEYVARSRTDCEQRTVVPGRDCNEPHCIRGTTMMARSRGENTRRDSWYWSTISCWDETGGRNYSSHGTARCLLPRSLIGHEWSYAGSRTSCSL